MKYFTLIVVLCAALTLSLPINEEKGGEVCIHVYACMASYHCPSAATIPAISCFLGFRMQLIVGWSGFNWATFGGNLSTGISKLCPKT